MGGKNRQAQALKAIRQRLGKYGISKDEPLVAALDRLLDEHASAVEEAGKSNLRMLMATQEMNLAKQGRDAAQKASSELVLRERVATFENRALREILEHLVNRVSQWKALEFVARQRMSKATEVSKAMAAESGVARLEDELLLTERE